MAVARSQAHVLANLRWRLSWRMSWRHTSEVTTAAFFWPSHINNHSTHFRHQLYEAAFSFSFPHSTHTESTIRCVHKAFDQSELSGKETVHNINSRRQHGEGQGEGQLPVEGAERHEGLAGNGHGHSRQDLRQHYGSLQASRCRHNRHVGLPSNAVA